MRLIYYERKQRILQLNPFAQKEVPSSAKSYGCFSLISSRPIARNFQKTPFKILHDSNLYFQTETNLLIWIWIWSPTGAILASKIVIVLVVFINLIFYLDINYRKLINKTNCPRTL